MKFSFYCLCLLALPSMLVSASDSLARADSLFALRDKGFDVEQLLADTTHINQAMFIYKEILEANIDSSISVEVLRKLLEAFYFKGQFGALDNKRKKEIYSAGIEIGEKYAAELPESVAVYSWLGILWARWADVHGLFAAARMGAATKIKYYGEKTVELDDHYLDAGGYRLLGMLYCSAPKIPLFLTWPSKTIGLEYLEKAHTLAPNNLYNKMFLAEVLYSQKQKERAKMLLDQIVNTNHIVHDSAIDSFIKQKAQRFIAKHY